jgi:pyruvate dehydrogenase E1 component alpha subunit
MLLINNHYAISTPVSSQTAASDLARRAEGYGFPGFLVDGNDLLAVYATTAAAVERALAGEGPTLIECRTYRIGFHNTSDNPKEYRAQDEVAEAERRDPIERVRRFATREGFWSPAREAAVLDEIRAEVDAAQRQVERLERPGAAAIFDHVYETLSPRLIQQRTEAIDDAG